MSFDAINGDQQTAIEVFRNLSAGADEFDGYPDGLRFEQIPLGARILRVADAYASLTDARPFRSAFTEQQAREHLLEWTGLEFDPRVVRALLALEPFKELKGYAREVATPAD